MESNFYEVLDARGDQGVLEIKSPRNQGLLHSDVDYKYWRTWEGEKKLQHFEN